MTKRMKDSLIVSSALITGVATVFTVIGFSMKDLMPFNDVQPQSLRGVIRGIILLVVFSLLSLAVWAIKGKKYENTITLKIGSNEVTIKPGDIFQENAWRVIAVDTTFSTIVDDVFISKTSLHGQLVESHGDANKIKEEVKKEAIRRKLIPDSEGKYSFPLGTAIPYKGNDGHYILVALTELNVDNESHTKMPLYENTLMSIWRELSRVYAKHDLAIPILGDGITRFDDGQDETEDLIRCMLCTLNTSKVHFKSNVSIIVYNGDKNNKLPLYEYKDLYRIVRK